MAFTVFAEIPEIEGTNQAEKAPSKTAIECLTWNYSVGASHDMGRWTGERHHSDINITTLSSKASAKFMLFCSHGVKIPVITFTFVNTDKVTTRDTANVKDRVIIKQCIVSSYSLGAGKDQPPHDQVTFGYAQIDFDLNGTKASDTMRTLDSHAGA